MKKIVSLVLCGALLVFALAVAGCDQYTTRPQNAAGHGEKIKIGLLHSHTGVMAMSEMPVRDAEKLAIDEINAKGGLLGRQIEVVERDGASDDATFAAAAKKLIEEDKVEVIFGCWTSSARKAVKPLVDEANILLWYPLHYEGLEHRGNIVYLGQTPNQQVLPAVEYLMQQGKRRMFLIGSDYIFPHAVNGIVKKQLSSVGGQCVGEQYVPLNHGGFSDTVQMIKATKPDVVINTLNGSSNAAFFAAIRHAGINADTLPIMSFSIAEPEISSIGAGNAAGNLVCQGYFQTVAGERNAEFVATYRQSFGNRRMVGDAIESGYNAVYMWKAAVEKAGSINTERIKTALKDLEILTPEGVLTMDGDTMHAYRRARIGRIGEDGLIHQFVVSDVIKPDPFLENSPWALEVKSE